MIVKPRVVSDLIVAIAGVLMFLGLAHWIDSNGYISYALPILLIGITVFFASNYIAANIPFTWVTKQILGSFAYILIFVGLKVYLDQFVAEAWLIYILLGIILLNQSKRLSEMIISQK